MMKFFRTHVKMLMAGLMIAIMISWGLLSVIEDWAQAGGDGGGSSMVWGDVYGKAVSSAEIAATARSTDILDGLHRFFATAENPNPPALNWREFWGGGMIRGPLQLREWYMLTAEAQRRGIQVSAEEVASVKSKLPAEALRTVRERMRAAPEEIDAAIESWLRVMAAFDTDFRSLKMSEADVQGFVRDMNEKAKVKLAVLETKQFEEPTYQPTPEELQQQFDKYKNVDPGTGPEGYGYRLPEEVQVEYIVIKAEELIKEQKIDEEDAERYWRENKAKYNKPKPPTSTAPAEPYENYTAAREAVRKDIATQMAKREALRIGTELVKTLTAPWAKQPATRPGYKTPPESAIYPNPYSPLVDALAKQHGSKAVGLGRTTYLTRQDLSMHRATTDKPEEQLPMLSGATALSGSREEVSLVVVAFLVPDVEHTDADRKAQSRWFHNYYETVPEPFVDDDGNVYVFRTVGAHAKRVAENWQSAKNDQVRRDLRDARAAKLAKARAEQLLARAKEVGVEAAVKEDPALVAKLTPPAPATMPGQPAPPPGEPIKTPAPFGRKQPSWMGGMTPTQVPEVGEDPEGKFVDLVFGMAGKTALADKVDLFENREKDRYVVVQLLEVPPVTEQEYSMGRMMAQRFLGRGMMMQFASAWLDGKNIRARVNYVPKYPEEDTREDRESF